MTEKVMDNLELPEGEVVPLIRDFVFKFSFDKLNTRNLLIFTISYISKIEEDYISKHIKFRNSEMTRTVKEKGKVADLLIDIGGYVVDIEVNSNLKVINVIKNNLYLNKQVSLQLKPGEDFTKLKTHVLMSFNRKNIEELMGSDLITRFMVRSDNGKHVIERYKIIYHINIDKAIEMYNDGISEYDKNTQKFIKLLNIMVENDILKLREIARGDDDLMALVDNIEEASKDTDIILAEYKQLADDYGVWLEKQEIIEEAEKATEEAVAKANEEAEKALAKANKKVAIETAKRMLADGLEPALIAKYTCLNLKEIENLK